MKMLLQSLWAMRRLAILALLVPIAGMAADYDIAAYVWPAYHPAARWSELGIFGDGKGEWQNVYEAVKRYPDDHQDARPLWGYENEADPVVVARKIDAATASGVNVFIYDWYWYEGRPFLEEALERGFLKAPNNERMRFYIMWANHTVNNLWNNRIGGDAKWNRIWSAKVSDEDFRKIVHHWINAYFKRPNYYRIKGCPVLSIYLAESFVEWEGLEKAKERIAYLRAEVRKAGFPDLHLQQVGGESFPVRIGADSMTTYNWNYRTRGRVNSTNEAELAYWQYGELALAQFEVAKREAAAIGADYYPHLACGWDTNARYPAGEKRNIVHGRNPRDFETFARRVKAWADANLPADAPRLVTVNSWNEWTEGSYLEPDDHFGYGYLDALRKVFVEGDAIPGAAGDGKTDDTAALQAALDRGGEVRIPSGTYLTGTLHLKSNTGIVLADGAELKATADASKWNRRDFCPQNAAYQPDWCSGAHLLCAVGVTNVSIRGGVINGNASAFHTERTHLGCCGRSRRIEGPFRPRQMLYFCESKDIRIEGVRMVDSPFWNCFFHGCENVVVSNVVIRSAEDIGENDGIDIDCSRNVRIRNCDILVGDDGVTCRASPRGLTNGRTVCEGVSVENCRVSSFYAHALRIGVGTGEIRNCAFRNVSMPKTRGGIWICSKYSGDSKGVEIHDIDFEDIAVDAVCWLFVHNEYRFTKPGHPLFAGRLDNIRFRNVRGVSAMPRSVRGNGVARPFGLEFVDCSVEERKSALDDANEREFFLYE